MKDNTEKNNVRHKREERKEAKVIEKVTKEKAAYSE